MVGGYDNGDQSQNYAFLGSPGSFAPFTLPFGLNDQNDVVGYFYEFGAPQYFFPQAFVWYGQTKTWQSLDAPGGWYTDLYGINDTGVIVGDYRDRKGIHGVVLSPAGK
jgi:hypothetical protein